MLVLCRFDSACRENEKAIYIQTYILLFCRSDFSRPQKLNMYVFITMQAEEIHIHTRKIDGFVEHPKVNFLDRAHVLDEKI